MKIKVKNPIFGVPITFLDKHCTSQFDLEGEASGNTTLNKFNYSVTYFKHKDDRGGCGIVKDKRVYGRLFIKRKTKQ